MEITYYVVGVLTGISVSTFFIGKELYKYYNRYMIQKKQLDRILKLYDKVKKGNNLASVQDTVSTEI